MRDRWISLKVCFFLILGSCHAAGCQQDPAKDLLNRLNGDTKTVLTALDEVGPVLEKHRELFWPSLTELAQHSDYQIRNAVAQKAGEFLIWKLPANEQDKEAIQLVMELSNDPHREVRYSSLYFGLTTVRPQQPNVVDRLIDLLTDFSIGTQSRLEKRFIWSVRASTDLAIERLEKAIATATDPNTQAILAIVFYRLKGTFPVQANNIEDTAQYSITVAPQPPYFVDSSKALSKMVVNHLDNDSLTFVEAGFVDGEFRSAIFTTGIANVAKICTAISASKKLELKELINLSVPGMQTYKEQFVKSLNNPDPVPSENFEDAFLQFHKQIGETYPNFESRGVDWNAVKAEFLPESKKVKTYHHFGYLCQCLIAKLEDSHAQLLPGTMSPIKIPSPGFTAGFNCLLDQKFNSVIYHVEPGSSADLAGLKPGMTVHLVNSKAVSELMDQTAKSISRHWGYSSNRMLNYDAVRSFLYQWQPDIGLQIVASKPGKARRSFTVKASSKKGYLPRLPVPIPGIVDFQNVSWTKLEDNIGYIYVRRMRNDLISKLDKATSELKECSAIVIDVRGNSGGRFDYSTSHQNFDLARRADNVFRGPIAVLIDSRCISAGEGWASWFVANRRAQLFGSATAGASSNKRIINILDGKFRGRIPFKFYKGYLDRIIERQGLEPNFPVRQSDRDLADGIDSVLQSARKYLLSEARAD